MIRPTKQRFCKVCQRTKPPTNKKKHAGYKGNPDKKTSILSVWIVYNSFQSPVLQGLLVIHVGNINKGWPELPQRIMWKAWPHKQVLKNLDLVLVWTLDGDLIRRPSKKLNSYVFFANPPFEDVSPIKKWWFSIAMLVYQRVFAQRRCWKKQVFCQLILLMVQKSGGHQFTW